jgi:PadR family transcriptional regulator, regulatory protein AphA
LLRLFFAEHGTKEDLLATLEELEGQALALRSQAVEQGSEYLAGTAPFPERLPILALLGRFTLDHTTLVADWARWARSEVERWPAVDAGMVSEDVVRAFEAALAEAEAEAG